MSERGADVRPAEVRVGDVDVDVRQLGRDRDAAVEVVGEHRDDVRVVDPGAPAQERA